ncbi:MAG: DUF1987 domain-containing protein [Bacteroidales bacterium]|nr:DUF1987 domain-containing protein [Bacteroidales bacterium]HPO66623.1 DUF1987 domain-containing protein [Bacteroidales bacterium]
MGLYIEKTNHTPRIHFEEGKLTLAGRSIPEDSIGFFEPLFNELASYVKNPAVHTEVNLMLEYSNSSTNRVLVSIFEILRELQASGHSVTVNWYYVAEDRGMYELGTDLKDICALPFALIEVDELPE